MYGKRHTCVKKATQLYVCKCLPFSTHVWEKPLTCLFPPELSVIIKQLFYTGQFCSQKDITYFKDFKTFSLQPKLISLALFLLILLGILYFYLTSNRMTKSHKIPRYRQTLITLKEHSIILALFLVVLLVDETVFAFMELRYSSLGPLGAFRIWWTQTLFGYFVLNIVIPALCLRCEKTVMILTTCS